MAGINQKRLLQLEDLDRLVYVSSPSLSPDGMTAAWVEKRWEEDSGKLRAQVVLSAADGRNQRRFLSKDADGSAYDPVFSPDGKKLAYLADTDGQAQIYVTGLEQEAAPLCVTTLRHGVSWFCWSPDSSCFAFTAPVWEGEAPFCPMTPSEREEQLWELNHMPRAFEELMYKFDAVKGIVDGSVSQVGLAMADGSRQSMLTCGRMPCSLPSWTPDGRTLYFYGKPYSHYRAMQTELFSCPVDDGAWHKPSEPVQITDDFPFSDRAPVVFLPNGSRLLYLSNAAADNQPESGEEYSLRLFSMLPDGNGRECLMHHASDKNKAAAGSGKTESDSCPYDGVAPLYVGITENGSARSPYVLSPEGDAVFFLSAWDGKSAVYRLLLDGSGRVEQITDGPFSVTGFCAPASGLLPILLTSETRPVDFFLWDISSHTCTCPCRHNDWLDEVALSEPDTLWMETDDPAMPVQGFFLPALDADGSIKATPGCPSFHYIHGGPEAFYAVGFDFEMQLLAASGIGVMYCNPRGSAGYGPAFVNSRLSYDGTAYQDLMDFTDLVLSRYPNLSPSHVTVGGGSHGGWMTNYIIGHTQRFYGAVTQRTWSNPATSYGTGDMGFYSQSRQGTASFYDYMIQRAKSGTVAWIDQVTTPLLILHGEKDYRCTLEQGEQMYAAMKDRNPQVPCRLVVFPGENHGITRTGRLHFQKAHLDEMRNWCLRDWEKEGYHR